MSSEKKILTKKRIYDIIQIGQREDLVSRLFDYMLVAVVIVNITVMFMETFDELEPLYDVFAVLDIICFVFFVAEYALRIYTSDVMYPELPKGKAIWKFLISFDGIVELLTILPFFFLTGFVALRMLRVVRIFHLFRINNTYDSFNVITTVLVEKKNQILSSVFIIFILMLASSLCMYSAEYEAQPDAFDNAFSGLWWSISTILTVGYGDIYPVTVAGRLMAIVIALLGVGVVAIPTGIISAGFVEQYTILQKMKEGKQMKGTIYLNADPQTAVIGMDMDSLLMNCGIIPLVIIRDGTVVVPTDDLVIHEGDTIVYHTDEIRI